MPERAAQQEAAQAVPLPDMVDGHGTSSFGQTSGASKNLGSRRLAQSVILQQMPSRGVYDIFSSVQGDLGKSRTFKSWSAKNAGRSADAS